VKDYYEMNGANMVNIDEVIKWKWRIKKWKSNY
jgi:hypothetical protein